MVNMNQPDPASLQELKQFGKAGFSVREAAGDRRDCEAPLSTKEQRLSCASPPHTGNVATPVTSIHDSSPVSDGSGSPEPKVYSTEIPYTLSTPYPSDRRYMHDEGTFMGVEWIQDYRPGGFHPAWYTDRIGPDGRFQVIHKLGYGDRATVWLCVELKAEDCKWKAVKIFKATESTEDCPELRLRRLLADCSDEELRENHISLPLEHFWLEGPNGRHLCLVSYVAGATHVIPPRGAGPHDPESLNDICFQVAKGINFLHRRGICVGDLQHDNIAMQLDFGELNKIKTSLKMDELTEKPYEEEITIEAGGGGNCPLPWAPIKAIYPPSQRALEQRCRTGKVILIGLGRTYTVTAPPMGWKPDMSRRPQAWPPELREHVSLKGFASDIWPLACLICDIVPNRRAFEIPSWYLDADPYDFAAWKLEQWLGPNPITYQQESEQKPGPEPSRTRSGRTYGRRAVPVVPLKRKQRPWEGNDVLAYNRGRRRLQDYLIAEQQYYDYYKKLQTSKYGLDSSSDEAYEGAERHAYEQSQIALKAWVEEQAAEEAKGASRPSKDKGHQQPPENPVKLASPDKRSPDSEHPDLLNSSTEAIRPPTDARPPVERAPPRAMQAPYSTSPSSPPPSPVTLPASALTAKRQVPARPGAYPNLLRPCTCYKWNPEHGCYERQVYPHCCRAERHWSNRPDRTTIFALTTDEARVFSDLLMRMLRYDPEERIGIEEVINHEWFAESKKRYERGERMLKDL